MQSELRIFVRKDLGFTRPQRMRHLEPKRGIGRAKLARLNEESEQRRDKQEQAERARRNETEHCYPSYLGLIPDHSESKMP